MSETITITIPTELKPLILGRATASGKAIEEYALELLKKDAELPTISEVFADVRAQFEASGMTDEELGEEIEAAVAEVRARRRA